MDGDALFLGHQTARREAQHQEQDQAHRDEAHMRRAVQQVLFHRASGQRRGQEADQLWAPDLDLDPQEPDRMAPSAAPQLLPDPPTITITQIRKV